LVIYCKTLIKMNNKVYVLLSLASLFLVLSCKKKVTKSNTPEIAFVSITPSSAKEFDDQIKIKFSYKDYNGDIGENDANKTNLVVRDNRNNVEYRYRVKQLGPDGATITLKGELEVIIDNTLIIDNSNSQAVNYSIKLQDRAGNWSNEITTTSISIIK